MPPETLHVLHREVTMRGLQVTQLESYGVYVDIAVVGSNRHHLSVGAELRVADVFDAVPAGDL